MVMVLYHPMVVLVSNKSLLMQLSLHLTRMCIICPSIELNIFINQLRSIVQLSFNITQILPHLILCYAIEPQCMPILNQLTIGFNNALKLPPLTIHQVIEAFAPNQLIVCTSLQPPTN